MQSHFPQYLGKRIERVLALCQSEGLHFDNLYLHLRHLIYQLLQTENKII